MPAVVAGHLRLFQWLQKMSVDRLGPRAFPSCVHPRRRNESECLHRFDLRFHGDGTTEDLLPGTTVNAFNRSMGREELASLITQFNQTYAGQIDGKGAVIPRLTLPERYWLATIFNRLIFV